MRLNKYAVRFPGYGNIDTKSSLSIFSETTVKTTEKTFFKTFNALESLTGFIIQKSRTSELGKQLNSQKRTLDVEIDNDIKQEKIQYEEEAKRLQLKIEQKKQEMDLELQRLALETSEKAKEFTFSYEKHIKSSELFKKIITREKNFLEETHRYIELFGDNFSNRKEYILYCDCERKSLELINNYLKLMI